MINSYREDLVLFLKTIKNLKVNKFKFFIIFIISIFSNVLQLATPLLFGNIINGIITKSMDLIKLNLLYMCFIFICSIIINYVTSLMLVKLTYNLEISIKKNIFSSISNIPYTDFLKIDKGKLVNNIEQDSTVFSGLISDNMNLLMQFINMIISFLFMWHISPLLTLITLVAFPITGVMHIYTGKKIKDKEIVYRDKHDRYMSFLYESLYGLKFLKLFNAENKRINIFTKYLNSINSLQINKFKIGLISQILTSIVSFTMNTINILIAVYLIFNGNLTLGMLTAFNEYSDAFKNILLTFSNLNSTIQEMSVSITRVNEILKYKAEEICQNIKNKKLDKSIKEIKIKNLSYFTDEDIKILSDVNIKFLKNNIYIIKGESGSGKTTLLNILSSFIDNYSGEILLNNIDLNYTDKEYLRNKISYITQDHYLFSMSIKENISLYRHVSLDDIKNVCRKLNIHDTIMSLPNQYDTVINKNGTDLSGGERQRLCIARAIVSNPDVYLFDEITSAIDKKNTNEIIKIIEEISKDSIVILTSHDDLEFSIPTIEYHLMDKNFELKLETAILS